MIAQINEIPEILAWSIGWQEVVLILVVVLLLFGGRKLPELARGLTRGLKAFKSELKDVKKEFEDDDDDSPKDDKTGPDDDHNNPYLENKSSKDNDKKDA